IGRWFFMIIVTMAVIGPALIWFLGGKLVIDGALGLGTVTAFVALLSRLYTPVTSLSGVQVQIASALAVFERIFEYLDLPEEEQCGEDLPQSVKGELEFDQVSFSYNSERRTLEDISFRIEPSKVLAVVGHSGAGKTSLANLIPRFHEIAAGEIKLDGKNIKTYKLSSLRAHIGMVTQETYLFHDTIEANLRYAKPQASREEIEEAARLAHIHDLVMSLPEGYQTTVGERGYKLSGGERQRLSIARVILKNPAILILDEATSALDSVSEEAIQKALKELTRGRTSLVIAHRLSTVEDADKIIVLDHGKIVESGTHRELMLARGKYAELAARQFKGQNQQEEELLKLEKRD
ncbi:MAG: ABC transporter ATP-binding protein, partial [Candidatus Melainabacteria bacterium]|nr:ABC transporter ATP-binding protein [Candidatus Melainabacteria bacterium]